MSKPRKDPFLPDNKQPITECRTCAHWQASTINGITDISKGRCLHSGLSTVPPRHVCSAWEKKNPKGRKGNR